MNAAYLKSQGIDYADGLHRFCDNAAMYEKYLYKFQKFTLYDEMKQSLAAKDMAQAFSQCHQLKAYVGNLSMPELYKAICGLTEILRADVLDESALAAQQERADMEYRRVREALAKELRHE